jgi:hypothetical protein
VVKEQLGLVYIAHVYRENEEIRVKDDKWVEGANVAKPYRDALGLLVESAVERISSLIPQKMKPDLNRKTKSKAFKIAQSINENETTFIYEGRYPPFKIKHREWFNY